MKLHGLILIALFVGITACKEKPLPKRALTCYVRVLEAEGRVRAEATMKVEQETGQMVPTEASSLLYQGVTMNLIPGEGMTYMKDFPGQYTPEQNFSWDGPGGKRSTVIVPMNDISSFGFGTKTLSTQKPATFSWKEKGLEKGESLVLLWENAKENMTVPMEMVIQGSLPQIEFPAAKLAQLQPGQWTLYLVRKKLTRSVVDGVQVQAITEFYSQTDTLTITAAR